MLLNQNDLCAIYLLQSSRNGQPNRSGADDRVREVCMM
jgi:hypothetical protein